MIEFLPPDGYSMGSEIAGGVVFDLPFGSLPDFRSVNKITLNATDAQGYKLTTEGVTGGGKMAFPFMRIPQAEMQLSLRGGANRTAQTFQDWQRRVWQTLHDAEFARDQSRKAKLQDERDGCGSTSQAGTL
jgi:hypothetical protein